MIKKNLLKLFILIVSLSVLSASLCLFGLPRPDRCYIGMGYIPPQINVVCGSNWVYLLPITERGDDLCVYDYEYSLIQGPPGMSLSGDRLYWTPTYSQMGMTFPVTLQFKSIYSNPYQVVTSSQTVYVTVVDCPSADIEICASWETGNTNTNDFVAHVSLTNNSSCFVATSGRVEVDSYTEHTWSNQIIAPHSSVIIWTKNYEGFNDCVVDDMQAWLTYTSIPNTGNNYSYSDTNFWEAPPCF